MVLLFQVAGTEVSRLPSDVARPDGPISFGRPVRSESGPGTDPETEMTFNRSMQRMRASRLGYSEVGHQRRLALTADAGRCANSREE